jgi:hypothetical protein
MSAAVNLNLTRENAVRRGPNYVAGNAISATVRRRGGAALFCARLHRVPLADALPRAFRRPHVRHSMMSRDMTDAIRIQSGSTRLLVSDPDAPARRRGQYFES